MTGLFAASLYAQSDRIRGVIDQNKTVVLPGQVPARARAEFDRGAVTGSLAMHMTIDLKPSPNQKAALDRLLANQRNPSSPDFHKWLTPEQYADRFGASQSDIQKLVAWLHAQGFTVGRVARSRTWIEFQGTAAQAEKAFHTRIDEYLQNGELHYANTTDPSIPAALSDVVRGLRGLNNYRLKPRSRARAFGTRNTSSSGQHEMAPDDFATIYDVSALYTAGIDGTGQKLAVVGQTAINLSDIQAFRSRFHLPAIQLQQILVPGHLNPGVSQDDLPEADLDIEWSGSVARNATVVYVYSDDVTASVQEAIDQDYAPVITMSYGICEGADLVDLPTFQAWAQQGNAQGITWLAASGDNGAADCEDPGALIAQDGLAVDEPGSIPEVTSMGGTQFHEGNGSYWSGTNTATGAAALSYIPEVVWNETSLDFGLSAGGGGTSLFFAKPVWQAGPGVPNNSFRNVPDLSIASAAEHDGYFVYTGGSLQVYGGTSVAAPTMAGIVTLLNQYLLSSKAQQQAGVGNINPTLYRMAQKSTHAFHDVTAGDNNVPCVIGSPQLVTISREVSECSSGSFGYSAAAHYDVAAGLGSPDAYNFVHEWTVQAPIASAVVPSIDQTPVFETAPDRNGHRWAFTLTLTEEAGVATTLTGFTVNGKAEDADTVFGSTEIPANGSISSQDFGFSTLAVPADVVFGFTGKDASGATWSQQLTVPFEGTRVPLVIKGASNAASGTKAFAPGMLVSVYGTSFGTFAQAAGTVPLPEYLAGFEATVDDVFAPLYYVSPNQVNIQIPYETRPGTATLVLGNPYANSNNFKLQIVPAAPGIFMTNGATAAPFSSAARGQTSTLYVTGVGNVSPAVDTGDAPSAGTPLSQLPKPNLPVAVTVAGQNAPIAFIGIPAGLVGVAQINYQVPPNTPTGVQPVVVTVGGVASAPANLTVTD